MFISRSFCKKKKVTFSLEEVKQALFRHRQVLGKIGLLKVVATSLKISVEEFIFA